MIKIRMQRGNQLLKRIWIVPIRLWEEITIQTRIQINLQRRKRILKAVWMPLVPLKVKVKIVMELIEMELLQSLVRLLWNQTIEGKGSLRQRMIQICMAWEDRWVPFEVSRESSGRWMRMSFDEMETIWYHCMIDPVHICIEHSEMLTFASSDHSFSSSSSSESSSKETCELVFRQDFPYYLLLFWPFFCLFRLLDPCAVQWHFWRQQRVGS